jgi:hypothetical protein
MKEPAFFDADGLYGSAHPLNFVIVDTAKWTPAMWDCISDNSDSARMELAIHFSIDKHYFDEKLICKTCELSNTSLPKSELEPDVVY